MDDQFSAFWQIARSIRLTPEEAGEIRKHMLISAENSVRGQSDMHHIDRMDQYTINAVQDIHLSPDESSMIRKNILAFARSHPIEQNVWQDEERNTRSWFFPFRFMPALSVLVGACVAVGGTLSVAAQSALPGDFLYPVKLHVNENVESALQLSADGRARFEAQRLENRLEEAGKLAAAGRLNGDVKAEVSGSIEAQLTRIQRTAEELVAGGNATAALDLHSQAESNLMANAAVLGTLAESSAATKEDVKELVKTVANAERSAAKSRVESEAKVSANTQTNVQAAAEGGVQTAVNKIEEARDFIEKMNGSVNAEVYAQASARFDHSKRILTTARGSLDAKQYGEAFRTAKEAQRTAQEAKTMLKVAAGLKMQGGVNAATTTVSSAPTPAQEGGPSAAVDADANTDTTVDIQKADVKIKQNSNGGVKVNLGGVRTE